MEAMLSLERVRGGTAGAALHDALAAAGEQALLHSELEEMVKSRRWAMAVTAEALYKFEVGGGGGGAAGGAADGDDDASGEAAGSVWRKRKDLMDLHSVEVDAQDSRVFTTYIYKSHARLNMSKMRGILGMGMDFNSFLQRRRYLCDSAAECFQWVFVLNRAVRNVWQREFERAVVPAPEVYQRHGFAIKVNRRGKAQDRLLVLSTGWVYNVEVTHNPTRVKGKKWALPVGSLSRLTLIDDARLIVRFDSARAAGLLDDAHLGDKGSSVNDQHVFVFRTAHERQQIVADLARLYYEAGATTPLAITSSEGAEEAPAMSQDFSFFADAPPRDDRGASVVGYGDDSDSA
jgi:hypothetical protein